MSSYQLGRIGITLLALNFLLQALLAPISLVSTLVGLPAASRVAADFSLISALFMLAVVALVGGVPAWLLIRNRDRIARRWFSDEHTGSLSLSPGQLVEVGLVLLGISLLVDGVVGALWSAGSFFAMAGSLPEESTLKLHSGVAGSVIRDVATLVAGWLLLRFAKPLSKRWID